MSPKSCKPAPSQLLRNVRLNHSIVAAPSTSSKHNPNTALEHKPGSTQPKGEGDRSVLFSVTNTHSSMKYPHLSHPSSTHKISVNNLCHSMPSVKQAEFLTAIATFSTSQKTSAYKTGAHLSARITASCTTTFLHPFITVQGCSNLSRPVKILTPFEKQWLLEGKAFLATMTKTAWKAGQQCPNHHHAGSSNAQHKALLISSPTFSYKSYKSQPQ